MGGWWRVWAVAGLCLLWAGGARGQDLNLSPTRPTIANSSTIQAKGVLRVRRVRERARVAVELRALHSKPTFT